MRKIYGRSLAIGEDDQYRRAVAGLESALVQYGPEDKHGAVAAAREHLEAVCDTYCADRLCDLIRTREMKR